MDAPPPHKGALGTDRGDLPWQTRTFSDPAFKARSLRAYKWAAAAAAAGGALWWWSERRARAARAERARVEFGPRGEKVAPGDASFNKKLTPHAPLSMPAAATNARGGHDKGAV